MATVADDVVVKLTAEISGLQKGMAKGAQAVEGVEKKLAASAARMRTALAALGVGAAVTGYVKLAEGWRGVRNQLLVSGVAVDQLDEKLNALFGVAQKHGADVASLGTLYSRLAQSAGELGASEGEMLKFVDGVAVALRVQGGNAEQASGALLQLSQAMGSATVRAEEFNSINEGARPILMAVANGMEAAGGSVSKLRALVLEGKVSSQAFFQAFLAGSSSIQAMADRSEGTVSQSMTRLQNSFTKFVGTIDGGSGASRELGLAIDSLSRKLNDPKLAEGAASALAFLVHSAEGLLSILAEIEYQFGRLGKFAPPGIGRLETIIERHEARQAAILEAGKESERRHSRAKHGIRGFSLGLGKSLSGGSGASGGLSSASSASNEASRAAERYRDVISDLKFELDMLGLSEQEVAFQQQLRNALSSAGVTAESERGQAIAQLVTQLQAATQAQREQAAAWEVEADNANRAIAEMQEQMRAAAAEWEQIGATIEDRIADGLVDIATNSQSAQEAIAGLLADIGKLIAKMLILKAIESGVDAIFGGGGSVGGKAMGGLVNAGNPYVVGESGPELFVPRVSGQIVPRGGVGGGSVVISSVVNAGAGVNRAEIQALLDRRDRDLVRNVIPRMMIDRQRRGSLQGAF